MRLLVLLAWLFTGATLLTGCIVEPRDGHDYGDHARFEHDGRDHRDAGYEQRDDRDHRDRR